MSAEGAGVIALVREADDWLAVDKPPGMETVDPRGGETLTTRLRRQTGLKNLAPVHRLDRDTSGVVLFGRTAEAVRRLEDWFRRREVHKVYLGLCLGMPRNRDGVIRRALSEWRGGHRPVRVVAGGGGLSASTRAVRLAPERPLAVVLDGETWTASLLAFEPHEGRTHQIRVHAEAFGHPILGDDQYGDRHANRAVKKTFGLARQALHAWRLSTPEGTVTAGLPEDIRRAAAGMLPGVDIQALLAD